MRIVLGMAVVATCVSLNGCMTSSRNLPLVFGQSHTVGISMGAGAAEQGGDLVLGYKDKNIAIVPVALDQGDGSYAYAGSNSGGFEDSFSVLGQFEVTAEGQATKAGLGKFFATGAAAKALADGFSAQMGHKPKDPEPGTTTGTAGAEGNE